MALEFPSNFFIHFHEVMLVWGSLRPTPTSNAVKTRVDSLQQLKGAGGNAGVPKTGPFCAPYGGGSESSVPDPCKGPCTPQQSSPKNVVCCLKQVLIPNEVSSPVIASELRFT